MARNTVDECLFCNATPCECNKKPKKAAPVKRVAPPTPPAVPINSTTPPPAAPVAAPKRAGLSAVRSAAPKKAPVRAAPMQTVQEQKTYAYSAAILNLYTGGLIDYAELQRHANEVDPTELRAARWRNKLARRG